MNAETPGSKRCRSPLWGSAWSSQAAQCGVAARPARRQPRRADRLVWVEHLSRRHLLAFLVLVVHCLAEIGHALVMGEPRGAAPTCPRRTHVGIHKAPTQPRGRLWT